MSPITASRQRAMTVEPLHSASHKIAAAALAFGLLLAGTAWADSDTTPPGDVAAGKTAAANCAACHGLDGISRQAGAPNLAGQHAPYILQALMEYKKGSRKGPPMQQIVGTLTDQDMANLAAYYASQAGFNARPEATGAAATAPAEPDPYAAAKKAMETCEGCHGEDGNATVAGTPSLAGQHAAYLIVAINAYLDGSRKAPMMQALVKQIDPNSIEDVAYYLAAMDPHRAATQAAGDPYAGVAASAPCVSCHGQDGNNTDPKIPRLAGDDAQYLEAAINAYKSGDRANEAMRNQVSALGAQDIKNIAAYYASKEPQALPARKLLTVAQWTEKCSRCHGSNGNSTDPRFPILAGQDETYLAKALGFYHMGDRANDLMFAMSFLMTQSDIKKLAAYYARQRKE